MEIIFEDIGIIDYKEAWDYQEKLFHEAISLKLNEKNNPNDQNSSNHQHLLFCEHPNVYTLGKNGVQANLLISEELIQKIGAKFYKINRGGDITYHGPGQIVGYPIFDIEVMRLGIREYIYMIEASIIDTLGEYGIESGRLAGATGVWIAPDGKNTRKICAIGVKVSRYVTMHGFALNVNTNLDYFRYINPCGFVDKEVTSMEKELGYKQNFEEIKIVLLKNIKKHFNFN
jgi:lipoyl(octanoyl) transferase